MEAGGGEQVSLGPIGQAAERSCAKPRVKNVLLELDDQPV